ncbi:flagellar protein FlaG [Candidatus Magnetobacterium casense]|uniref:Flagellar protein FlaG n=1 Tax=Candidatus Magnetobacterium casense TaxID=1455061 RepID=A0ABS6RYS5_9BACT|nr:flagellar protein FlaG [Candidatus Magnetobacterium casensis]MBV6341802.1 flagellar protein FlaG [Candidatus Magnetobacterium casensis]
MVEAVASIMPVGLAMKVDVSGIGDGLVRDISGQLDNSVVGGGAGQSVKWNENDNVAIKGSGNTVDVEKETGDDLKKFANKETDDTKAVDTSQSKAYFEIDEDEKVIIKVVDAEGKLLKQIPPDDYKKSVRRLEETYNKLFHKEA